MSPKDDYKKAVGNGYHDDDSSHEQEPTSAIGTLLYVVMLLGIGLTVGVVVTWIFSLIPL